MQLPFMVTEEFDMATWVSFISKKTFDMEHGAMIMNET